MLSSKMSKVLAIGGSAAGLALGFASRVLAVDPEPDAALQVPIQTLLDYARVNLVAVIGIVVVAVATLFVISLGIKMAFKWIHRAVK